MIDTDEDHPLPDGIATIMACPRASDLTPEAGEGITTLVALDGSSNSEAAFDWAAKNIVTSGDTLILLKVLEESQIADQYYADQVNGTDILEETLKKTASELLHKYATRLTQASPHLTDVEVTAKVKIGAPQIVACEVADDLNVSRLVMGSRGLGMIKRMLFGSVSAYCMDHSHVPVTVVRVEDGQLNIHEGGNKAN
ncbi:uncharacterized protein SPPG_01452 [Spizellomyces punctatus DAOM BR117]|uniref:UspA domain-containing protein n=1 Tax=Spizellomyces punctatus (strain DAOM BR117) TaxID=645134 RepID=A0A0L0HT03_SPIPD|nr:uncharacterized protein SPPG_01452 [Spizellomyces punctatus DAOM BR117]KND04004.1 hypothetical protein SPPG_01452 [Spizellomyces punctatus DAOM BR117]|eukprot:XP_016612043.1 hypothetical protein SPPG_01452 [Spizellomyces punctatus DAOM BR117]